MQEKHLNKDDPITEPLVQSLEEGKLLKPNPDKLDEVVVKTEEKHKAEGDAELNLDEIPILSDRKRDFAFRFALETHHRKEWAKIFKVSPFTIDAWKKDKKIRQYYLIVRRQRDFMIAERYRFLEDGVMSKYKEILDIEVTDENMDAMRKVMLDILAVTKGESPRSDAGVNIIQQNINKNMQTFTASDLKKKVNEMELFEDITKEEEE